MTWTYDVAYLDETTATGRRNVIRLLIGDTVTSDQQFMDEEIDYFLDVNNDDVFSATKQAVLALIAKYSREVDTWMGHTRVERSQRVRSYNKLYEQLCNDPTRLLAVMSVGGISKDANDALFNDSDVIQPFFRRNMDNQLTANDGSDTSDS